ncbi:hypothetical protein G9A89_014551 [Geosiphon pyriformis]|nr:hypothetical protein G9A89_014551 [Geosiphon pyriformis]
MLTLYHHHLVIADQNWYASIATRNCHQWAHAVAMTKNTPLPPDSTATHTCQYTILINDWVCKGTPIDDAWKRVLQQLEGYSHDEHELWRMAYAKAEGVTTSELLEIKNNPLSLPKPEYVQTFNVFGNIENNPEEFHEHYQQLVPTIEEQKQCLKEINT